MIVRDETAWLRLDGCRRSADEEWGPTTGLPSGVMHEEVGATASSQENSRSGISRGAIVGCERGDCGDGLPEMQ